MEHDVFICHASEDKDELVRPLAAALKGEHVDVWYDEFSLKVGDSLRQSIDRGLAGARFGVVVLSPAFFKKSWTQWELNGLVTKMTRERRRVVLPIWHHVGLDEVAEYSLPLADIHALQSGAGIASLCEGLMAVLRPTASPLMVAKEELARFGWNPPPISDEWWLDIVERQSDWNWPIMDRQPWMFPLSIGGNLQGYDRGLSIAWTALQLAWQEEARQLIICQTTHPEQVFAFIEGNTALQEACIAHPDVVANYAPQLLIPQYSGRFGEAFDELVAASAVRICKQPDRRFPNATCERYFALRLPDFGGNPASAVADKWINGRGGESSAKHHHITDYLFWLFSEDSCWMPIPIRNFLTEGMREWAGWNIELTYEDAWNQELARKIYGRPRRAMRWTRSARGALEETIERSLSRLGISQDAYRIAERFIEHDFIGGAL